MMLASRNSNKNLRYLLLCALTLLLIALPMGFAFAQDDEGSAAGAGLSLVCAGIIFIAALASAFWVYRDASDRGSNGCLWALFVWFIFWPISLIIYIFLRPKR
ncbi:MAG: hypothetical protein D8M56_09695 [Chloroflexi bacterium]|nr:hypothetical protein [Chloroflexota bacterium]